MNKRKWLIVAAVIVATAATYVAVSFYMKSMSKLWDAIFPARSVHTTSLKPVNITLTDTVTGEKMRLRIPKAYLTKNDNWKGGEQEIVFMQTRLPDMQPGTADPEVRGTPGSEEYETTLTAFNNGTHISLNRSYGDPVKPDDSHERVRERLSNTNRIVGASEKYERVDDYFGLERYRVYTCSSIDWNPNAPVVRDDRETCMDTRKEIYLSKNRQQSLIKINCNTWDKDILGYRLGCHASTSYRGHPLSYLIRYTQISRWQEFDTAVRRLLDGFIVETTPFQSNSGFSINH